MAAESATEMLVCGDGMSGGYLRMLEDLGGRSLAFKREPCRNFFSALKFIF